MSNASLHESLRIACAEVGIVYKPVAADGRWHETDVDDDWRGRGDARIKLFADGEGGHVWNWKGAEKVFFVANGHEWSHAEKAAHEKRRQEAIQQRQKDDALRNSEAVTKAAAIWKAASPAGEDHPYLARKHVKPVSTLREMPADKLASLLGYAPKSKGEALAGRVLIVPVKVGNKLSTAELIDEAGRKSAIYGGAKAGGYWSAQPLPEGNVDGLTLQIGEGVATVLSAKEATGHPSIAALSSGNLPAVAKAMRERYPTSRLVILADLVKATGEPDLHAVEAARLVGGLLAIPDFGPDRPEKASDFNDMAALRGLEAVRATIHAALKGERQPAETEAPAGDSEAWSEPQPLAAKIEPEPYPLDALPGTIRAAVQEVTGFVMAPAPMVASSALAALSLACQAHMDAKRLEKLTGPVGLFILVIADSGERKTTCDGFFSKTILDYEAAQAEAAIPAMKDHRAAMDAWEAKRAGIKEIIRQLAKEQKSTAGMEGALRDLEHDKPEPPRIPRLLYADVTPEALAYGLAKQWPSGGVVSAEAGIVFGSHGMGRDSVMRNLGLLNQLWDGKSLTIDRRTTESFTVKGARLTVALQVQEPTLREFFARSGALARGTGFLARFLVAWPESTQGTRLIDPDSPDGPATWPHLAAFHRRIAEILEQPVPIDDDGALTPPILPMTPEAKAAWVAFHNAIEGELSSGGELHDVKDVASKIADNAARLAALFQMFQGSGGAIGLEAFEGASRITAWHLNESRRFFGELALPAELADAARLDGWLMEYCRRECTHHVPTREAQRLGPVRDKERLMAALRELEELDRVRVAQEGRRKAIKVNPALAGVTS